MCEECTQADVIIKLTLRTAVYNGSTLVCVGVVAAPALLETYQGCLIARVRLDLFSASQDWWPRGLLKLQFFDMMPLCYFGD